MPPVVPLKGGGCVNVNRQLGAWSKCVKTTLSTSGCPLLNMLPHLETRPVIPYHVLRRMTRTFHISYVLERKKYSTIVLGLEVVVLVVINATEPNTKI